MPIYMKIEGVEGNVTRKGFEKWIEVESFGWGLTNTPGSSTGGGGATGKPHFQDFHVTKKAEKGSPILFLDAASGKFLPAVQLVVTVIDHDHERNYYKVVMEDVLISSFQDSGDTGGERPSESLSFNYSKIHYTIYLQSGDGSVVPQTAGWDVRGNKPI